MKSPKFNSVGQYLASAEPTEARILRSVIDLILAKFPELESKIPIGFIPLYIRLPFLWRILGKQFLLVATKGPNHAMQRTAASPYVQVTQSSRVVRAIADLVSR